MNVPEIGIDCASHGDDTITVGIWCSYENGTCGHWVPAGGGPAMMTLQDAKKFCSNWPNLSPRSHCRGCFLPPGPHHISCSVNRATEEMHKKMVATFRAKLEARMSQESPATVCPGCGRSRPINQDLCGHCADKWNTMFPGKPYAGGDWNTNVEATAGKPTQEEVPPDQPKVTW